MMPDFQPVEATFVHLRGRDFGAGTLTHVPCKGDWVELGQDCYLVKRLIWNLNQDPCTVQILVDHVEEEEDSDRALNHNIDLIKTLSEQPAES